MSLLSLLKGRGPSGFGYGSTAQEVTEGLPLTGKLVVVTGITSGIGHESARVLALRGARVFGTARTVERARAALAPFGGDTVPFACELEDPASVRACVAAIKEACASAGKKIDAILCNAGVMAVAERELVHGVEKQFFTNHIGHFLLVTGLLEVLSDHGRVVMTSSGAHKRAPKGGIVFDDLACEGSYSPFLAYGQSKMANIHFAKELARRFAAAGTQQKAYAVHPGVIATSLGRHMPAVGRFLLSIGKPLVLKSEAEGAATQVLCAVHPWVEDKSGAYFADCNIATPRPDAEDAAISQRLWEVSEQIGARI